MGGEVGAILHTRVARRALGYGAARVLPSLPNGVPMKAKFGKRGGDFAGLLVLEPNPNPLAGCGSFAARGCAASACGISADLRIT